MKPKLSDNAVQALSCLRKLRKSGSNENKLATKYMKFRFALKRERRKLKKEKKNEAEAELLELHEQNSSSELWKRINGAKKRQSTQVDNINPQTWINHFDDLYNVEFTASQRWDFELNICPDVEELDREITSSEVSAVVKNLKNNKAGGRDLDKKIF